MKKQIKAFLDKVQDMRSMQTICQNAVGAQWQQEQSMGRAKMLEEMVDVEAQLLQAKLASIDNLSLSERARVIGELMLLSPKLDRLSMSFVDQLIEELKQGKKQKLPEKAVKSFLKRRLLTKGYKSSIRTVPLKHSNPGQLAIELLGTDEDGFRQLLGGMITVVQRSSPGTYIVDSDTYVPEYKELQEVSI